MGSKYDINKMIRMKESGKTYLEISREMDISTSLIHHHLKKASFDSKYRYRDYREMIDKTIKLAQENRALKRRLRKINKLTIGYI